MQQYLYVQLLYGGIWIRVLIFISEAFYKLWSISPADLEIVIIKARK